MRLVAFGDSFTHGYGVSDSIKWKGSAHPNLEGYKHIAQFIHDELKEKLNLL